MDRGDINLTPHLWRKRHETKKARDEAKSIMQAMEVPSPCSCSTNCVMSCLTHVFCALWFSFFYGFVSVVVGLLFMNMNVCCYVFVEVSLLEVLEVLSWMKLGLFTWLDMPKRRGTSCLGMLSISSIASHIINSMKKKKTRPRPRL